MSSIDRKFKICFGCEKERYIWKNNQGYKYCIDCWNKIKATESKNPLTSVAFKLIDFSKISPKKPYKIKAVSNNRQEALKVYRRKRDKYLEEHPICEFPGCSSRIIQLHHKRGRIGAFLTDKRYFCSLCDNHHKWCHENDAEARKLGLLQSRLEK